MFTDVLAQIVRDPAFPESQAWRRRAFEDKEVIVRAGELERKIFLVEAGKLRVTARVQLDDDKYVHPGLRDLEAGDVFGEMTLFNERPRIATVTALSKGELLEIDCEPLIAYMEGHKDIGYELLKYIFQELVDRFGKASERVEYFFAWGLKERGIGKHL